MKSVLEYLQKFYLSVVNDKTLLKEILQKECSLPVDVQEKIIENTILSPYSMKYSPPISYQKFFLRTILDAVESNGCETSDSLIESYANVVAVSSKADQFYRTYIIKDGCAITIQESSCFVTNSTTGFYTWEASKYLLEWCLENAPIFKNKKILELGSGIGLLGISIVKLCQPSKYLFSDKSLDVLNTLTKNIEINLEDNIVKEVIQKHQLLWGTLCPGDVAQLTADFILGADITYDPSVFGSLVKSLKMFLVHGITQCAYIASTIRSIDTNEYFIAQLDLADLTYEVLNFQTKEQKFVTVSHTYLSSSSKIANAYSHAQREIKVRARQT